MLVKIILSVIALYAVMTALLFAVMLQSPDRFAATMKHVPWPAFVALPFKPLWQVARAGNVKVGRNGSGFFSREPGPQIELPTILLAW